MTSIFPVQCYGCARLDRSVRTSTGVVAAARCEAYPGGIPEDIGMFGVDHRTAFGGETGGLLYAALDTDAGRDAFGWWQRTFDSGILVAAAGVVSSVQLTEALGILHELRQRLTGAARDELDGIIVDLLQAIPDTDAHMQGLHDQASHGRQRTGVLGNALGRLTGLRDKLDGADRDKLDEAIRMLQGLESGDVDDDDLIDPEPDEDEDEDDGPDMESASGDLTFTPYADGDMDVDWDDGMLRFSQQQAREVAAAVNEFINAPIVTAPEFPGWPEGLGSEQEAKDWLNQWYRSPEWEAQGAVGREMTTGDGSFKVVRYNNGVTHVGDPESIEGDDAHGYIHLDDPDQAREFARLLTQTADQAQAATVTTAAVSTMPAQLQAYWLTGEGAAKVRWCTPGSFRRARRLMLKEGVPAHMVDGTVANLYRKACGKSPGRHRGETGLDVREYVRDSEGQFAEVPGGDDLADALRRLDQGRKMFGSDRSKWPKHAQRAAKRYDKIIEAASKGTVEDQINDLTRRIREAKTDKERRSLMAQRRKLSAKAMGKKATGIDLDAAVGGCPPGRHRMPDGSCMDDADMYTAAQPGETTATPAMAGAEVLTAQPGELWHAVVHREGVSTGKRTWLPGSVEWREPPFAAHHEVISAAHGSSPVTVYIGNVTRVVRDGPAIHLWGDVDLGSDTGMEWARRLVNGYGGWPSFGPGSEAIEYDVVHAPAGPLEEPEQVLFRRYRMGETTFVSVPGQENTFVEALPALIDAMGAKNVVTAGAGDPSRSWFVEIPNLPPADWFREPESYPYGYAVTMLDDGHIFGLIAPHNEAHRTYARMGEKRTLASLGKVDFSRWARETIVEGGKRVLAGPLTMECMHAPKQGYGTLDRRNQYYEDSCSIFARVAVGNAKNGEGHWLSGAAMPGVTAEQVLKFLACGVSGDWQPHPEKPGWVELVAVLAVPAEGWPKSKTGVPSPVTRIRETAHGAIMVASAVPTRFEPSSPAVDASVVYGIAAAAGVTAESRVRAEAARIEALLGR